jgi:hypothetical protein
MPFIPDDPTDKPDKPDKNNETIPEKHARLKKEASPPIKPKFYFDVKVECMLPATLTYRVLADDAQQAADLIRGMSPTGVKHRLIGRKELKLAVYDAGSNMIRWMKNLIGT